MYDAILVPTDGSAGMEQVADQAVKLASLCEATIHALYVVDESAYASIPVDARDQVREALTGDGETATDAVVDRAIDRGLSTVREVRRGDPAVTITTYAVENDIDLIVMGTRGRTGFERFLLGSVAEKVVRISPVPVLTVHIGDPEGLREEIEDLIGAAEG